MDELVALGAAGVTAALLARGGRLIALPTIPAFMVAGILLGPSVADVLSDPQALGLVADIGLIVLLFHLGLEFPAEQVMRAGGSVVKGAIAYIGLNLVAGLALGFALGWGTTEALVIAGAVAISSSAIVTKLLVELNRLTNAETPVILGIIVVEDIFLAAYLALLGPLLGESTTLLGAAVHFALSFTFIGGLLVIARYGGRAVGRVLETDDEELVAVLALGLAILAAGIAEDLGISEAIGALMIGLVVSGTSLRERAEEAIRPIRDAFAAIFFVVFGAGIALDTLGEVVAPVAVAVALSIAMCTLGGVVVARLNGLNQASAANAALVLLGRGEFSLILATLAVGAGLDSRIAPFVALYVLVLALVGPILAARSQLVSALLPNRLVGGGYRYVGQETIVDGCPHVEVMPATPRSDGCEDCRRLGDDWVELRVCLECGYVGCCDDSKNRHATRHHEETGHPAIATLEPDEAWRYCYVDRVLVTGRGEVEAVPEAQ